jgi:hypothetical protein
MSTPVSPSTTGGAAPSVDATKQHLTDSTNANALLTGYAHALANVHLAKLDNQGEWYPTFNAALLVAQQHANLWIESLGPQVFSQMPQAIIDYGNTFTPATNDILQILAGISGPPTPTQQQEINQLLGAILDVLTESKTTLGQIQAQLTTFATDIQTDHTALLTGQHSAENELITDSAQLLKIQGLIDKATSDIATDSQKAMMSEIGLGVAIFVLVVGIALAVATGGAAAPLIVAGVGLVGIGAAIGTTVYFSEQVSKDIDELHTEQQALTDEQRQVTALTGVSNSIQGLVAANETASTAISSVLDTWSVLEVKLRSVIDDLAKAEAPDVPAIIETLDLQAAQTAWSQLSDFATGMQKSAETIQVQIVTVPAQTQAA